MLVPHHAPPPAHTSLPTHPIRPPLTSHHHQHPKPPRVRRIRPWSSADWPSPACIMTGVEPTFRLLSDDHGLLSRYRATQKVHTSCGSILGTIGTGPTRYGGEMPTASTTTTTTTIITTTITTTTNDTPPAGRSRPRHEPAPPNGL